VRVDGSFDEFVEGRSTALLRTAYLLTGDRGHAEDLLQTALMRTARHWHRARESPEAYVRKALVNLSHDRIRGLFRRPREAPLPADPDAVAVAVPGPDAMADRMVVVRALAALPTRQRQVVVLRYFDDLTVEQTAALLDCSTGTVKSYTSRALARLRELLGEPSSVEVPHVRR
jgi:RNA polymerase sigma-70 factor (sigma-E family)